MTFERSDVRRTSPVRAAAIIVCLGALGYIVILLTTADEAAQPSIDVPQSGASTATTDVAAELEQLHESATEARDDAAHSPTAMTPPPASAVERAGTQLARHATDSLNGTIAINDVLDQMIAFARLPVSEHPDLDYEDGDSISFKLEGAPQDTDARLLLELQPVHEGDRTLRTVHLAVDMDVNESAFHQGAMRSGPSVTLGICYDVDDPKSVARFTAQLQRNVALAASRQAGIDAYDGRFTTGASFWLDLMKSPASPLTSTFGLIDGNPASGAKFDGVSPLAGDTQLDPARLAKLVELLQAHVATIKGE